MPHKRHVFAFRQSSQYLTFGPVTDHDELHGRTRTVHNCGCTAEDVPAFLSMEAANPTDDEIAVGEFEATTCKRIEARCQQAVFHDDVRRANVLQVTA